MFKFFAGLLGSQSSLLECMGGGVGDNELHAVFTYLLAIWQDMIRCCLALPLSSL